MDPDKREFHCERVADLVGLFLDHFQTDSDVSADPGRIAIRGVRERYGVGRGWISEELIVERTDPIDIHDEHDDLAELAILFALDDYRGTIEYPFQVLLKASREQVRGFAFDFYRARHV